jgi:hypothetical protein
VADALERTWHLKPRTNQGLDSSMLSTRAHTPALFLDIDNNNTGPPKTQRKITMTSPYTPSPSKMGQSGNRGKNIVTAKLWLNRYLLNGNEANEVFTNTNYPNLLSDFTEEHVEGDNVGILLEAAGVWLATNEFSTRQGAALLATCKKEYFKNWVVVLRDQFPSHALLLRSTVNDWFPEMLKRFEKHCARSRQDNLAISEDRKSEPLYRNIALDNSACRAKYHGECGAYYDLTIFVKY